MIVSTTFVKNAPLSAVLGVGYADVTAMGLDVTLAPLPLDPDTLKCPTERHEYRALTYGNALRARHRTVERITDYARAVMSSMPTTCSNLADIATAITGIAGSAQSSCFQLRRQ